LRAPNVAKGPRIPSCLKIYPALPISENKDLVPGRIQKILINWVTSKMIPVFSRKAREVFIEVRVLLESETLFRVLVTAEIPKNF
jgi:hypothetical protein